MAQRPPTVDASHLRRTGAIDRRTNRTREATCRYRLSDIIAQELVRLALSLAYVMNTNERSIWCFLLLIFASNDISTQLRKARQPQREAFRLNLSSVLQCCVRFCFFVSVWLFSFFLLLLSFSSLSLSLVPIVLVRLVLPLLVFSCKIFVVDNVLVLYNSSEMKLFFLLLLC